MKYGVSRSTMDRNKIKYICTKHFDKVSQGENIIAKCICPLRSFMKERNKERGHAIRYIKCCELRDEFTTGVLTMYIRCDSY